ncbi:uncharacterized protein LOC143567269 [Bidens hawaiensis]|uniref:uncharacterized protein LOC143567269 n=1 Tax=Bidens hawaiensis TaxID=980011 RepID=UPI00404AC207
MYKGFDKQQQELVEATSKALAYKQDIMEENVRIRYALQLALDEDTIFVSSLVPLLADQSFHPANIDAYSVVSSLRLMFKHYQERINISEQVYQPLVIHSHHLPSILEEEQEPEDSEQDDNESDEFDDVDININNNIININTPLPTVEDLQITGDPYPGNTIQASGYSRKGTTRCGFEWVRYLQDGSMKYIEGATLPDYTVTADDLDNYLAVIVQPLDDKQ